MAQFIRWYDNALTPEICRDIFRRFDADPRKIVGKVSGNAGPEVDLEGKQTIELILPDKGWDDIKQALQQSLSVGLSKYQRDASGPKYACTTFIHPRF